MRWGPMPIGGGLGSGFKGVGLRGLGLRGLGFRAWFRLLGCRASGFRV